MVRRRDFGGLDETRVQSLRWCFPQTGELSDPSFAYQGHCEMRCTGSYPLRRLETHYRDIVGEPATRSLRSGRKQIMQGELDFAEPRAGAELQQHAEATHQSESVSQFATGTESEIESSIVQIWEDERAVRPARRRRLSLRTETLTPYSYQINPLQVRHQSLAKLKGNRAAVVGLVREFDVEIEDVEIVSIRGARPVIYLRHRRLGPAPLSIFGDALRRAVLIAGTLPTLAGGVLLIDEIEAGIHRDALARVFSWLVRTARELNVQIFATTHSLEAIDAILYAEQDELDDLATFRFPAPNSSQRLAKFPGRALFNLRYEGGLEVR
ncbi:MAG TPA: AAA family ATPase [Pirellulales bacterium]|nr:AAA family ATPase [Pirellulales bacterium]